VGILLLVRQLVVVADALAAGLEDQELEEALEEVENDGDRSPIV
jgi:hypothetical protein